MSRSIQVLRAWSVFSMACGFLFLGAACSEEENDLPIAPSSALSKMPEVTPALSSGPIITCTHVEVGQFSLSVSGIPYTFQQGRAIVTFQVVGCFRKGIPLEDISYRNQLARKLRIAIYGQHRNSPFKSTEQLVSFSEKFLEQEIADQLAGEPLFLNNIRIQPGMIMVVPLGPGDPILERITGVCLGECKR